MAAAAAPEQQLQQALQVHTFTAAYLHARVRQGCVSHLCVEILDRASPLPISCVRDQESWTMRKARAGASQQPVSPALP